MLYLLLYPLADKIALFNVLRYPTFRMLAAGLTAMLLGLFMGPRFIEALRVMQYGVDNVREDTPESHKKKGTPSMGGLLLLFCLGAGVLLFADLTSRLVWSALVITFGFGGIGFIDDWLKYKKRNSKGLAGKKKLALQAAIFLGVMLFAFADFHHGNGAAPHLAIDTRLTIPFVKVARFHLDLGWFYLVFAFFLIVGTSNAVNLTDGLDGLAIGPTIVSAVTFMLLAYLSGLVLKGFNVADYLLIPHIDGASELAVFGASLAGAGIAFLWFNCHPAEMFMGDVGSLAIGGALGSLAMLTKNEVDSAIIHGVFLAETLSVMIQVFWFKRTGGKRIFLKAPLHHHFEEAGVPETKIVVRFWITSIFLALVALASIKLR
ncbi:MAG: phospho-N-acetylmuramoyl-pentapeptide-transferase [Deltaproteobacteria bacterium]|nr:phospho-N-acetylmuramoyl-pentapeptide-transferase [Deltaproteobacteria bacterium]